MNMYTEIKQLTFYIYEIQQQTNLIMIKQLNHITLFSFITLFTGGILTSFSPCMISCIPLIIPYLPIKKQRYNSIVFLLGIITSILGIGLSLILIKTNIIEKFNNISLIIKALYLIMGLNILEIVSINFSQELFHRNNVPFDNNLILTYIFGLSIGLSISPCNTPILVSLIIWITNTKHIFMGISFLCIYTLGYLSPIIGYIIFMHYFKTINSLNNRIWLSLKHLTGAILISISTCSLCNIFFTKIYF